MPDFGTDLGNTSLSVMAKLTEGILKVIGKVYDGISKRTSVEYRLKKAELAERKDKVAQAKLLREIEGSAGYINHEKLVRAGVPLTACGITLDEKSFSELANRCKREGILISGIEDMREKTLNGKRSFIIECKQSDLPKLASLIDLMNDEKKIEKIDAEISKLKETDRELRAEYAQLSSIENPSEDDIARMGIIETKLSENAVIADKLNEKIQSIRYEHGRELNSIQSESILSSVASEHPLESVGFSEAVDRWTGGSIDKDTTCYVVDATEPDRYIVCNSSNDSFRGQEYIKTTYDVYNGRELVYSTDDARFEGRTSDYWVKEKNAMKEHGGIGDTVYKFYSQAEFEAYRNAYAKENDSELQVIEQGKNANDYSEVISQLKTQLEVNGAVYENGEVLNKQSGEPLVLSSDLNDTERAKCAESLVIGKQISNYEKMAELEKDAAMVNASIITAESQSEQSSHKAELESINAKRDECLRTEATLIEDRKGINAVQSEQQVQSSGIRNIISLETEIANGEKEVAELLGKYENSKGAAADSYYIEAKTKRAIVDWKKQELEELKKETPLDGAKTASDKKKSLEQYKAEVASKKEKSKEKSADNADREKLPARSSKLSKEH